MNNDIQISAGLAIIQDNKILLEHPTNSPWFNSYSIPKGQMEPGENSIQTAIRETEEELGIVINPADILSTYCNEIKYTNKGVTYKIVQYFVLTPSIPLKIDLSKIQKEEIDWAGFLTKEEAEKRIFWRQKDILKLLK